MNNNPIVTGNNLPPLASRQKHQSEGIDVRDALTILSSRIPHVHDDCGDKYTQEMEGSCCRGGADNEMKNMGQTIDLFAPSEPSVDLSQSSSPVDTNAITHAREKKLRESLVKLQIIDLLKIVLKCQEDRVKTYGSYDKALEIVLLSKQLTDYPPACLSATAAFFVLSDTIMAVRDEITTRIENKNIVDSFPLSKDNNEQQFESSILQLIFDLQEREREKLQLTAAFHLEQIRANNVKQQQQHDDDGNGNRGEGYQRELALLNKGLDDLRSRIETCKTNINDILEDLRCCLIEKLEEENETDPRDIQQII